jgi:hypothetical protein
MWQILTNVSEEPAASIIRAEAKHDKNNTNMHSEGGNQGSEQSNGRKENGVKNSGPLWGHFVRAGYSPHHEKLTLS